MDESWKREAYGFSQRLSAPPRVLSGGGRTAPLARVQQARAEAQAQAQREEERRVMRRERAQLDWEWEKARWVIQKGEERRQLDALLRQEQCCALCGFPFNKTTTDKTKKEWEVKKETDWCRPDKQVCGPNDNDSCLARQERDRKAKERKAQRQRGRPPATQGTSPRRHVQVLAHTNGHALPTYVHEEDDV